MRFQIRQEKTDGDRHRALRERFSQPAVSRPRGRDTGTRDIQQRPLERRHGDHAVIIWPLLCGLAKARYHLLTNKPLSGAEAERIGLVAVAVPDAQVLDTALEIARTLCAGSATAMRFTKHALNNWLRLAGPSFDTSLALEFLGFKLADVREGLAAARDKRRPSFDRGEPQ